MVSTNGFISTSSEEDTDIFLYPGTLGDYLKQATIVTCFVAILTSFLIVTLVAVDRIMLGEVYVKQVHLVLLAGLIAALAFGSVLISLSLAGFAICLDGGEVRVKRLGREESIGYDEISNIEKIRIPGWWPIRADLLPRAETARYFLRIKRKSGPAVTFAGGLAREEDLIRIVEERINSGLP